MKPEDETIDYFFLRILKFCGRLFMFAYMYAFLAAPAAFACMAIYFLFGVIGIPGNVVAVIEKVVRCIIPLVPAFRVWLHLGEEGMEEWLLEYCFIVWALAIASVFVA